MRKRRRLTGVFVAETFGWRSAALVVPPERARESFVLHAGRQVGLGRFDEEVVVVAHQDEGVESPTVSLDGSAEPVQPPLAVRIVPDDRLPLIPAGRTQKGQALSREGSRQMTGLNSRLAGSGAESSA